MYTFVTYGDECKSIIEAGLLLQYAKFFVANKKFHHCGYEEKFYAGLLN